MRYFVSVFIATLSLLCAAENMDEAKILMMLKSWNHANNTQDIDKLSRLYAPKVKYYGKVYARGNALQDKKRFFAKHPYFSQSVQNVAYRAVGANLTEVIFDKYVRMHKGASYKIYPSYLFIDQSHALPAIVEEGDSTTNRTLKRGSGIPTYTLEGVHELMGKVTTVAYYGPPGYGEDPAHDQKLTAFILNLDHPIRAVALNGDELSFTTQTQELQLVGHEQVSLLKRAAKKGETVTLRGELFSSHTGNHVRDLLMNVQAVRP